MCLDRNLSLTYADQLCASDFNALLEFLKIQSKETKSFCEEGAVKVSADHSIEQDVNFFIIEKNYENHSATESKTELIKKRFIVFNVAKDAEAKETQRFIPWISEVIKKFREKKPEEKGILLIPMTQCLEWSLPGFILSIYATLWGDPSRKHFTLVEVDLSNHRLVLHDSMAKGLYPEKIKEILNQVGLNGEAEYRAYNKQKDQHSCGYFVFFYILSLLTLGHSSDFENIKLSATDVSSKKNFLESRQVKLAGERDKTIETEETADNEDEDMLLINKLT